MRIPSESALWELTLSEYREALLRREAQAFRVAEEAAAVQRRANEREAAESHAREEREEAERQRRFDDNLYERRRKHDEALQTERRRHDEEVTERQRAHDEKLESRRLRRAERAELYRTHVLEVRFQVLLNWDRTKHYLIFNAALVGAGAGLVKIGSGWMTDLFAAGLCVLAAYNSRVGAYTTQRGHEYYRRAAANMSAIAKSLGYNDNGLAIATTEGQDAARRELPPNGKRGRITAKVQMMLRVTTWTAILLAAAASLSALHRCGVF